MNFPITLKSTGFVMEHNLVDNYWDTDEHLLVKNAPSKGFKDELLADRKIRSLSEKPKGRGIDGVYSNPNPPPYIITETKFRTDADKYISDGKEIDLSKASNLTPEQKAERLLGNTKDGTQMGDKWVKNRLPNEVGAATAEKIEKVGAEKWLMIVDTNGEVVEIYKLNEKAKVIGKIPVK